MRRRPPTSTLTDTLFPSTTLFRSPSWLIWAFAGRRGTMEVWPALLVAGLSFAIPQYLVSNFHGPWLVDVVAAICSMLALAGFLRLWQPKRIWTSTGKGGEEETPAVQVRHGHSKAAVLKAWRSAEHTSEIQSLMSSSYAVFCLYKKTKNHP